MRTLAEVFPEAAAAARERIRRDARALAGDARTVRFLERLAEEIFDAKLDVPGLLRSCGVSRPARDRFTAKLGPPKASPAPWALG